MRYWQRESKMQGWVMYERCRERIFVRLPPPQDVQGKKQRRASRPGTPSTKDEGQNHTVMADSAVLCTPRFSQIVTNDCHLYGGSPPYQNGHRSSLGHDLLHRHTRGNNLHQDPTFPDIPQTRCEQNLTHQDSSTPDLECLSVHPDSVEFRDPGQYEADEDWPEFSLSHCLNTGNVWKLCWEDEQSASPIFDEGQQSLARIQCPQQDDVQRLLFPIHEESRQSLARRPSPQRGDLDRPLLPVLDKDQPEADRSLSPILEESCQSEKSMSPVPEESHECVIDSPLFPLLDESCQSIVDRLSPIVEEDDESAVDRPLSPILEEDDQSVENEHLPVTWNKVYQPMVNRLLSPILEEDCQSITAAPCQEDEPAYRSLSSTLEQDHLLANAGYSREEMHKPLSPISEESCSPTSSGECPQNDNEGEDIQAHRCHRDGFPRTSPERHQSLGPDENHIGCDSAKEDCEDAGGGGGGDGEGKMPVIHNWYLVDPCQKKMRLPRTMLFLGRDECDIIIQSGTVDKRHAVITFDLYLSRFKVKDLSTTNGTYVNESRIPEQEYVTLNHMDTIRLGYDSKVYHMEQGEPCGGDSPPSPSPPLYLQQSPPPPPIHVSGGGSTCTTTTKGPVDTTGWSSRHKDSSPMAECQGCIAEQRIEHTCTHATPSHHHHHHPCPIQDPDHHPQFVDVQRKSTDMEGPGQEPEYQTVSPPLDPAETEAPPEQKIRQARNTWPRKKVRQTRRAVAADLFAAADDDDGGVGEDIGGEILVENGNNYFVSVDDSAVGDSGRGRVVVEYSLSRTGSVHRIPRNSKHPLPPELETVKKGTPLYGQPSWWGEDTDPGDKDAMEPQQKPEAKSPRPSSLVMHGDGSLPHHQDQHPKGSKPVYMEIPHRAASPERDKPQRDKTTPARSLTSSLSKDSLVLSPDSARERSVDKDSDPGKGTTGGCAGEAPNSNPALSFTVEFGDERKKARLKSGASLSQFVPMKLRNSLSSHARTEKVSSRGRDSDGSCKNSEERELSPIASVKPRRPSDEPCGGSETPSKGKSARRSSGQGTGVGSLKSSDFGTDTTPVSTKSRKDGEKKTREAEKEVDKKPPKPQEPRKSSSRTSTTKGSKTKPQPSAAAIAASVQAAQYSDPTAYLIDRMFAGATESPRSTSSDPERSESPAAPEHVMYKEAREYDRASHRGSGTYRASGSKPAQKQKSLSKSPASSSKSPVVTTSTSNPKSPVAVASPRTASSKTVGSKTPEKQSRQAKEKSVEPERPLVAAVPAPQALPKAPSPIGGGGGDQEDKVSEAGTYTIEVEEDGEEELMARQQIDEVFGVDVNSFNFERPVIGTGKPLRSSEGEEEEGEEKTLHEDEGESMEPGCHTPCDVEGENVFDEDDEDEVEDEEGLMSRSMGEEEVPSWVSQLNSLTSGIRHSSSGPGEAARKEVVAKGTEDASKKPPQGLSRKRPGTGRKLPSIPSANDQSPVSSEHSSHLQHSPSSPASAAGPARLENGHDRSMDDSPSRNVKFSPAVSSTGALSGKAKAEASPCGSEDSGTNNINSGAIPKGSSSMCSRGSIDTELLLRDTETVMAAMEARMGFRRDKGEEEDAESDTDLTSTVAMVNGDEDFVKPTKYNSPRDKMTGKVSKDKDNSNIRIASASSSRKSLSRSLSEQKPPLKSPRSAAGVSVVSDVFSRSNSLDQSFQSDVSDGGSSDRTETTFSRSGSRGKGTITMTKPNRAFALRRARADGSEVTDTARSRTSAASTAAAASSRRSSSIHGTPRTSYSDRTGTEASLGAQIAKKARDNTAASKARESSVTRGDRPPRDSLRATDRRSSASSSASSTISSAKKERDIRTLKSQLKSTPGNKDLAIRGVGSGSQSQPGSRSNSPKAAERMAWRRRKEYDPRKAVAEAKAKAKEPRPKPKVQSSSLYKQRMTRSASFTNSVELSGRVRHETYNVDSISSVEDLSSAATAVSDPYGETGFRRAFIPFHNPLRSDRLSHSADEDEAGTFPSSQEPSNRAKPPAHPVSLMLHKSAFTPPLSKLQTPSPDSPSPQSSLLLRRRTLGAADFDEAGASTAASSHRTQADSYGTQSSSPQSYDSLIVSSIYQLSLKLKTTMDKALMKLREQDRASITPSPIDDFLGHAAKSEIPAWKSANQELAGVLKNLRKMEHHLHLMERALFPDEDTDTEVSGMSSSEKHKYFQEIERIRSELAGFQPIDAPQSQDPGSPEMAELSKNIH